MNKFEDLAGLVDDTVTEVYIPTPENWKCERKNCKTEVKHTHKTFTSLE